VKIADVDWNKHHIGEAEWEEKQRRRYMKRLAQYQQNTLESPAQPNKPRMPPEADKASQDVVQSSPAWPRESPQSFSRSGSSWGRVASNVAEDVGLPPRTASSTLSNVWRRALSSPNLKPPRTGGSTTPSAHERARERLRSSEAWFSACEGMGKEELFELVEHVHSKVLEERVKRREAEADFRKSVTWGDVDGPPLSRSGTGLKRLSRRQATPAVHAL